MIRIRIGQAWKEDPQARRALMCAEDRSARTAAARGIIDVVSIEVDGIDIGAGRTEGSLLAAAEGLVRAVARLTAGDTQASVTFQDGAVELLLRRKGGSALLTVVTLQRPARVLAHDVEVDLEALTQAAQRASRRLCRDLAEIQPLTAGEPFSRRLLREATQLGSAAVVPAERSRVHPRSPWPHRRRRKGAPTCSFELRDDEGLISSYRGSGPDLGSLLSPGRIALRSATGREIFSLVGTPFLLLRDLSASAATLVAAVRTSERAWTTSLALGGRRGSLRLTVALQTGILKVDGRPAGDCSPLLLAQAFLEAATDFCGAVVARNPRQATNGYLIELRAGARELLAHVHEMVSGDLVTVPTPGVRAGRRRAPSRLPLGPGRIRHLSFRRRLMVEVGAPCGLVHCGRLVIACGACATRCVGAGGTTAWQGPGGDYCGAAGGVLLLSSRGKVFCLNPGSGTVRWSRPSPLPEAARPSGVWLLGKSLLVLSGRSSLCAIELGTGRTAWRFAPPTASSILASTFGALLVVGTDTGLVYGLDAAGRVAWRLHVPGVLAATPEACGSSCLLLSRTERGGSLLSLEPSTGRRQWEAPCDFTPSGAPVPFAGLIGIPGTVSGDPVVAAIRRDGHPAWIAAPSLGRGALALTGLESGIALKSPLGPCALLDRAGAVLWNRMREAAHPPPGNVPLWVVRGVTLCSAEHVEVLDTSNGKVLGSVPMVAPVRFLAGDDLTLYGIDAEGLFTVAQLTTRLSVV